MLKHTILLLYLILANAEALARIMEALERIVDRLGSLGTILQCLVEQAIWAIRVLM